MSAASKKRALAVLQILRAHESQNVTFIDPAGDWPIVWERAKGCHVWDSDGKKYLDLTAAFGVAAAGHACPEVVAAGQKQLARLPHAMGDVHPHPLKAELCQRLSKLTFERWSRKPAKVALGNSGFEAVEIALKTAMLATGRKQVLAFEGAYHGLGYGALTGTHRSHFRQPFQKQIARIGKFLPFPRTGEEFARFQELLPRVIRAVNPGAILVEPVQGRGGIRVPHADFLPCLRRACSESGVLLVLDEIYTGFGRTGKWFACELSQVVPDLICLGKALSGGFPISACVGTSELMDKAWPASDGEAIHTSTFLGNPVGCAMALAQLKQIQRLKLPERAAKTGRTLLKELETIQPPPGLRFESRGSGLLCGLEVTFTDGKPATQRVLGAIKRLLHRGYIFLPEGEHGNVVGFTPPLIIPSAALKQSVHALEEELQQSS